ncbi:MAG: hypothetical protein A2W52_02300 [Candidatus Taylorbacteria bacterium RIFCSPHIGHO2_02_49_25]|uniref:Uncharacterized protein n=1 Tax=Candidatus Taylorbacteria bacterium RIFCSPHIGHO2_02_49_25 TaxID=1802305 RepID=A0A1G2MCY4_9BACT|nr:MAG: hypothetical protein A2W52_02300 [Candidatus Taylorbacteria bacterium RIFCSPHIGHO2_02_49_25]OHA37089.1 MAG: hypothetical protein A3B27_01585 [Candidatus Taylorbacteria bacterium RIFCSPLOWO2_01_FULL_50_130]OHA46094.1 MAG: hypothetical protein A3G61_03960 [Candidatus Taylorbacteria bacterium RIFCSPLOWO2_12_FULL_49_67]
MADKGICSLQKYATIKNKSAKHNTPKTKQNTAQKNPNGKMSLCFEQFGTLFGYCAVCFLKSLCFVWFLCSFGFV